MQPPANAFAPPPLERNPVPSTVRTFGILAIVLGGLQVVSDVFTLLSALVSRQLLKTFATIPGGTTATLAERQRSMEEYVAFATRIEVARAGVMFLLSGTVIVIGALLLRGSENARRAALAWSVAALAALVARGLVWELLTWPHVESYMKTTFAGLPTLPSHTGTSPLAPFMSFVQGFAHGGEYFNLAVLAAFPIVLLVGLTNPALKAQMRP